MDEYQRLMAERNAEAKRKRTMFIVVALAAVGGGGYFFKQSQGKAKAAQAMKDAGGRFAERDTTDMGAFWTCIMGSQVNIGQFAGVDQIQQKVESAYFTQQKTFSEHLTTECIPKLEAARSAASGLVTDSPAILKAPLEKYLATLPKLQEGLESYAEKLKSRGAVKDVDQSIQEVGAAFSPEPTAESVAFEKFLVCAIPDLDKKKEIQDVLQFLADTCKKDPVAFMTKVRADCGSLVSGVDKDAKPSPSKTFKANAKKFYEEDQRQLQAWEYCGRKSRKGKKQEDLGPFLNATGDYMEARHEVARTAQEEAARIMGQQLPPEREKAGGAEKGGPPGAAPAGKE
jgi:hypothetical protein